VSGILCLGVLWAIWITATFWMDKDRKERFPIAFCSLILMISFSYKIQLFHVEVQLPAVILLIIGYYYIAHFKYRKILYMLISIFIIMIGYAGLLLIELYDPVWIVINRTIMYSILFFMFAQLLASESMFIGITIVLMGTIHGEFLYAHILHKWDLQQTAGSYAYLDCCAAFVLIECSWVLVSRAFSSLSMKDIVEKDKQG